MAGNVPDQQDFLKPDELKVTIGEALQKAVQTQIGHPDLVRELQDKARSLTEPRRKEVMSLEDFKNGNYLEPGDVVLTSRLDSFFATLIWLFDRSRFAHVGLVYDTPHYGDGIDRNFLIEVSMSGVDIKGLAQFVKPAKRYMDTNLTDDYVVGIKRLEADWAHQNLRKMAAARMLHFINSDEYNFRLLFALLSQRTRNFYFRLRSALGRGSGLSMGQFLGSKETYVPAQFICSGFVQYAYIDMVRTAVERSLIDKNEAQKCLEDVIFCSAASGHETPVEVLMSCTPRDLDTCNKLQWKYLIHQQEVFPVSSQAEADHFFEHILPERRKRLQIAA
jgi:hypothetical protein